MAQALGHSLRMRLCRDVSYISASDEETRTGDIPIPLGSLASGLVELVVPGLGVSTIVEVDEERLKVFASGARWVSLSSVQKSDLVA